MAWDLFSEKEFMNQIVQLALASANQGDKNKAMEYIRQALASDAKDVDAWLVLSAIVDQEDRKRQCLNRVLSLEPTNQIAREELLEMDRAAMGNFSSTSSTISQSTTSFSQPPAIPLPSDKSPTSQTQNNISSSIPREERPRNSSGSTTISKGREKPQVFRYPIYILAATYLIVFVFGCFSVLAIQETTAFLLSCGLFLLTLLSVWIVSAKVEVGESGITTSRLFGLNKAQVKWAEIASVNSKAMGQVLELVTKKGSSVKVTSQVSGYSTIVGILRERRPDLFNLTSSNVYAGSSTYVAEGNRDAGPSTASFSGGKTFTKGMWRTFGSYIIVVPFFLISVWTVFTDERYTVGASIAAAFCLFLIVSPFFEITELKVEGSKITLTSMFDEKEITASQVSEVRMKTVRRRSAVYHFPVLVTDKRKEYALQGFPVGDEILYGFLLNWWNAYRYKK